MAVKLREAFFIVKGVYRNHITPKEAMWQQQEAKLLDCAINEVLVTGSTTGSSFFNTAIT